MTSTQKIAITVAAVVASLAVAAGVCCKLKKNSKNTTTASVSQPIEGTSQSANGTTATSVSQPVEVQSQSANDATAASVNQLDSKKSNIANGSKGSDSIVKKCEETETQESENQAKHKKKKKKKKKLGTQIDENQEAQK